MGTSTNPLPEATTSAGLIDVLTLVEQQNSAASCLMEFTRGTILSQFSQESMVCVIHFCATVLLWKCSFHLEWYCLPYIE